MEPKVISRDKTRAGRGFSYLELKKAKIDIRMAKNLGLRVDKRRRTAYDENVELLGERVRGGKKKEEKKERKKGKKIKSDKKKKTIAKTPSKIKKETV